MASAQAEELRERTKRFALRVVKLAQSLPHSREARVLGTQLLRAGTSIAANYRAACRGRSRAEFIAKLGIVVEEADETLSWCELLVESGIVKEKTMDGFMMEAKEILSIFAAAQRTARSRSKTS
ncbi:MAG TPA: four helix bundle protein [Nitrospiraceae bacterium]|nr:four helix bundle protein [Nitrospiraceae bacterium]